VIVVGEVPFGAVADKLGRKPLVVAASVLMVLEMGVLLAAPVGKPEIAFWFFFVNRVLSGCAEALASGADEALAYDSIVASGQENQWPDILKRMMAWQSGAFFFAMLLGGAVFDAEFLNKIMGWFGSGIIFEQTQTVRFPIVLTFITGCIALGVSMLMIEPKVDSSDAADGETGLDGELSSWSELKTVFRWLFDHKVVMSLILIGLLYDSTIRMMVTLGSEYLRLIQYPEFMFGVLGALTAGTGWIAGIWGKKLADSYSRSKNLLILGGVGLVGLFGVSLAIPYWGYGFWVLLMIGFGLLNFFMSTYINAETSSKRRATVLSVKSLAFNVGYGMVGLLYAGWNAWLKMTDAADGDAGIFEVGLPAFPIFFVVTYFVGWVLLRKRFSGNVKKPQMNANGHK
jgi:MFS family permease